MNYPKYYGYGMSITKVIDMANMIDVEDTSFDLMVHFKKCDAVDAVNFVERCGKKIEKSVFDNALQSAITKLSALVQKEDTNRLGDIFKQLGDMVRPNNPFIDTDADDLKDVNI